MRRHRHDPLATSPEPRWLKLYDPYERQIESQRIEPFEDLRGALERERARREAEGWVVEWAPSLASSGFYMSKDGRRCRVGITPFEEPLPPHSSHG
jgi:hypothetical protein